MHLSSRCLPFLLILLLFTQLSVQAVVISDVKLQADGTDVTLTSKAVTYSAPGFFYVQEDPPHISGIRVESSNHNITHNTRVTVSGIMRTNAYGERYIEASSPVSSDEAFLKPVLIPNKFLGGSDWRCADGGIGQKGVFLGNGLNNIGILVKVVGRITYISPDNSIIYVNDYSDLDDGNALGDGGVSVKGVRVAVSSETSIPVTNTYVSVTGISSISAVGTNCARTVMLKEIQCLDGTWGNPGDMIYVPAGSFLMGNNGQEPYSPSDEKPQHQVYLSGYWIGKYEVTRGEYRSFIEAGGYSNPDYWSTEGWEWKTTVNRTQPAYWDEEQNWGTPPGVFYQYDSYPVIGTTYYEADAYCRWAGGYLPTEAQWEKAARWTGTNPCVYPWGDLWDSNRCNNWYDGLSVGKQTSPVGRYPMGVSPYGCHDMSGNVWEWCRDWYSSSYYTQTPSEGWIDPEGPLSGNTRIVRGGSWGTDDYNTRCADRSGTAPDVSWNSYGFRLAHD